MIEEDQLYIDVSRIPVLIGKEGKTKQHIEHEFGVSLHINSKTGEVIVSGEDSSKRYIVSLVIQGMGYGFSPEHAMLLDDENNVLDVIDVKRELKNHDRVKVVMGRIIGHEGQTRRLIEEITGCNVTIKDSMVGIIGRFENVQLVHEAVEMLIKGASHKSFYGYLERNKTSKYDF